MNDVEKELEDKCWKLDTPLFMEVSNTQSDYFGEVVFLTHIAEALDTTWYRAKMDYQVSELKDVLVWFKASELEDPDY